MIDGFVRIVLGELLDQYSENIGTALVGLDVSVRRSVSQVEFPVNFI